MISKKECEKIIGHVIRPDTYLFMQYMSDEPRLDYNTAYEIIDNNRQLLGVKESISLTKEETCKNYLSLLDIEIENNKTNKEKMEDWKKCRGIYCIKVDNEIVYIGETNKSFQERFRQHKNNINNSKNNSILYLYLRQAKSQNKKITMEPMIIVENLEFVGKKKINQSDIFTMEYALITVFQPKCNVLGRLQPYCYGSKK